MVCSACAKGAIVEINMQVNGSQVTFQRCGHCEAQGWVSEKRHIDLTRVLELARQGA